jgi:hypothetical protein
MVIMDRVQTDGEIKKGESATSGSRSENSDTQEDQQYSDTQEDQQFMLNQS